MTAIAQRQPRSRGALVPVPSTLPVQPVARLPKPALVTNPDDACAHGWATAALSSIHAVTERAPKRKRLRLGWIGIAAWVVLATAIAVASATAEKRTDGVRVELDR